MADFSVNRFKSELEYFSYIMERYFRKAPPIPTNIYLSGEVMEDRELRVRLARHCHFPAIINTLVNDEDDAVRKTARQNEYWQLVGRYQDILGFGRRERKAFAKNEGQPNILILLMFEDDPEVLKLVMQNPTISVKMVVHFLKLLQKRGNGRKDEQIYEIALDILKQRKQQIIKIASINKAAEQITHAENIRLILNHFLDADPTVRKSIFNILKLQDAHVLRLMVNAALEDRYFRNNLEHFTVITEILRVVKQRDDLQRVSVSAIKTPPSKERHRPFNSVSNFFLSLLQKKRLTIVRRSAAEITDFNNITLLAYCHVDSESTLRKIAHDIMPVDDIFDLLNDVTTPRKNFRQILNILENHMDEAVVQRVHDTYLAESRRLRDSLKELELTVQAYFDIIFQSLGYNRINEYMNVVRSIKSTQNQINKFNPVLEEELGENHARLEALLEQVKKILTVRANVLYFDTGPKIIQDMQSIFNLIEETFDLKEMGLSALRPGTPKETESEVLVRARTIWQSAISTYLGRIKDLTEMIRKKILKAADASYNRQQLLAEMDQAGLDLENSYKEKISCQLSIRCQMCTRRGCAAERFLREAHFFIKEFLDNFVEE